MAKGAARQKKKDEVPMMSEQWEKRQARPPFNNHGFVLAVGPWEASLPEELIDQIIAAHAAARDLAAAVEAGYLDHRGGCAVNYQRSTCSCGFDAFFAAHPHLADVCVHGNDWGYPDPQETIAALEQENARLREQLGAAEAALVRGSDAMYWMNRTRQAEAELTALRAKIERMHDRAKTYSIRHRERYQELKALRAKAALADEAAEVLVGSGLGERAPDLRLEGTPGSWRENWLGRGRGLFTKR